MMEILYETTIIERNISNTFYFGMAIITIIAVYLMFQQRLVRFSLLLWLISGTIDLLWESYLFFQGQREYSGIMSAFELLYHAVTEAGPGLIIMVIMAEKLKLLDLTKFREVRK
ncbi:MAG: hypothetical protein QXT63_00860 [Thermoplasmata archaeon]